MLSWKRLRRTTEGTSGPVGEVCSEHGSGSPQVHPYQQLVEALMAVGEGKEADLLCKKYSK